MTSISSVRPAMARERKLDDGVKPCSTAPESAGRARAEDDEEIASVARRKDELVEILMVMG